MLYQEFQLDKLLHNGEEDSKSKRRRKSCVQVATSSGEYVFLFYYDTFIRRVKCPIASISLEMPTASGKPDSRMSVEPSSFDAASTSQVRLKDAYLGGLMEEQRGDPSHQEEENSGDSENPAAGIWYYEGEPVAQNKKAWGNPLAHGASSSVDQDSQKKTEATWDHCLHVSPDTSYYMEAVFSIVRKIFASGAAKRDCRKGNDVKMWLGNEKKQCVFGFSLFSQELCQRAA